MADSESNGLAARIREVFTRAREIPEGSDRDQFLDSACGSDANLRREVESLIQADTAASAFLTQDASGATMGGSSGIVGTQIAHYRVLESIGEGGFGEVYRAEQTEPMRREVALKIIKPGMDSREVIARFEGERQALALMDHPNIAQVYDAGTTEDGRLYFVMELARGVPITDYCDDHNLALPDRLKLFRQVCAAVQHAHQKGVIHRDLKPSNIVVTDQDGSPVPKIIDFGIAKSLQGRLIDRTFVTQRELFVGTPAYMSPEQLSLTSDELDTRTDIYSLGVLLYELIAGVQPFESDTLRRAALAEVQRIIREVEPPRPSTRVHTLGDTARNIAQSRATEPPILERTLRGDLDWIVMKAIEKDRNRRYQGAGEFAQDILRYLERRPVEAGPPSRVYRTRKFIRRNQVGVAFSVTLLLALICGLTLALAGFSRASKERDRARVAELVAQADSARALTLQSLLAPSIPEGPKSNPGFLYFGENEIGSDGNRLLRQSLDDLAVRLDEPLPGLAEIETDIRKTLADSYLSLDLALKAGKQFERLVELNRELYGPHDVRYADSLTDYASALDRNFTYIPSFSFGYKVSRATPDRQWRKAVEMTRQAVRIYRKNNHVSPNSIRALGYLGKQREVTDREELYRELLENCTQLYGEDSLDTMYALRLLAGILWEYDRVDEALPLLEKSRAAFKAIDDSPYALSPMGSELYGRILADIGRSGEAERVLREEISRLEDKVRGEFCPEYEQCLLALDKLLFDQRKPDREVKAKIARIDYWRTFDPSVCRVDYTLRIQTPGNYRLFLRWDGHNDLSDAVCARIRELHDGVGGRLADFYRFVVPIFPGDADFATVNNWQQEAQFEIGADNVDVTSFYDRTNRFSEFEYTWPLYLAPLPTTTAAQWQIETPGNYTLQFIESESGAAIDACILQLAELPSPDGPGPERTPQSPDGSYHETEGRIVIEAENFTTRTPGRVTDWQVVPRETDPVAEFVNYTGEGYLQVLPERDWFDPIELLRYRAWAAEYEKRLDDAIALHNESVDRDPSYESWWFRARTHERLGNYEQAAADYSEAIKYNDHSRPRLRRAECYLRLGRNDDVIAEFQEEVASGNAPTFMQVNLALAWANKGLWHEAVQSVHPRKGASFLWWFRGDLYARAGDFANAKKCFLKAIEEYPADAYGYIKLATLYLMDGDGEAYKMARQQMPVPTGKNMKRHLLFLWLSSLGPDTCPKPDELVSVATRFLDGFDRSELRRLSLSWYNFGPLTVPDEASVRLARAEVVGAAFYRAGRYNQAAELLAEAHRIDRDTIGDYRSRWTFFLSMALHQQGQIEEARSWYDQAIDTLRAERISVPENEDPAWPTHSWNNRITVELIRQEAAGVLGIDLETGRPEIPNNP